MVKLFSVLSHFNAVNILVIGDFMLDTYTRGKVRRISPEAPVPVLHVEKEESLPGGAGNVALNILSLGGKVRVLGRIGLDDAGNRLRSALEQEGVDVRGLLCEKEFRTPVKNRLIAESQQVLRVDFEKITKATPGFLEEAKELFLSLIQGVDLVAISDYGKGFLSKPFLQEIIQKSKELNIPVIVDPKDGDFSQYKGATLIKPNMSEAYSAAKCSPETSLEEVASLILARTEAEKLLITRSEQGISLFYQEGNRIDFPVRSKEVIDVTGAGDTVLAMLSMALANRLDIEYAAQLSNVAAGIAIEHLGCARVNLSDMASRLLEFDVENKIFDEEHLFALQQALKNKKVAILGVDSSPGMTTQLFRALRKIASKTSDKKLIIYLRDENPDEEFISQLSSLSEVDFIILQCESLKNVCELIHPHEVFSMEEGTAVPLQGPAALLARLKETSLQTM